jgi:hypothetical protein
LATVLPKNAQSNFLFKSRTRPSPTTCKAAGETVDRKLIADDGQPCQLLRRHQQLGDGRVTGSDFRAFCNPPGGRIGTDDRILRSCDEVCTTVETCAATEVSIEGLTTSALVCSGVSIDAPPDVVNAMSYS